MLKYLRPLAPAVFAFAITLASPCNMSGASAQTTFTPTRFTVVVEGPSTAPPVLLLPGLGSSRAVFDAEAKLLVPAHRLYRVQINGFAGQPAGANATGALLKPVVEELHQYLIANKMHPPVIGHSLGGLLGLMLADAHPSEVQKLLIVDALPFYALLMNPAATVETITPQAQAMRDGMSKQTPEQSNAMTTQIAGYLVKDPDAAKLVAASSIASDRTVFANAMYEDMTTDVRPDLAKIATPATLLYPYDPAIQPDPAAVDKLYSTAYAAMPHINLHRIDGSRHFIMYDQPAAFDQAVQTFLK